MYYLSNNDNKSRVSFYLCQYLFGEIVLIPDKRRIFRDETRFFYPKNEKPGH